MIVFHNKPDAGCLYGVQRGLFPLFFFTGSDEATVKPGGGEAESKAAAERYKNVLAQRTGFSFPFYEFHIES